MLKKQHIKTGSNEHSKNSFSEKEKEFLDLICDFLVDDIFKKLENAKKEGDRLCEDQ
ncbi:hypothetical protein SAMN05421741_13219 [Paenimyroides ummariense]|uniref:Uncharacterized protein n=1 Tax=Paenimyroides ummariense TaxID=913024 RepID=A0A1I5FVG4_9FLAO|nr:hypothetical protein [Paenimyroides ummariense]SFO27740.1 hypothetical protein SAMN05421741_13219 [Paenimyroides ummariense]